MLLGRASECAAIERVLAAASQPVAAALVLCGPPGIGKTSLLDWAVETASHMDLLRTRALEGERHLRWALLRKMMKKVPVDIAALVPNQQDALAAVASGTSDEPVAAALAFAALLSAVGNRSAAFGRRRRRPALVRRGVPVRAAVRRAPDRA